MDVRLKVLQHNGTCYVNLPIEFCRRHNLVPSIDMVDIVVHQIVKKDRVINLVKLNM